MSRRYRRRTQRRLRVSRTLVILRAAGPDEVAGRMSQTDRTVGQHLSEPQACYFRRVLRRSMTYARASIAVRVSTAMTTAFAIAVLTAPTGSAETRRVVVRVYETGIGDLARRTAAIQTASSIIERAGVLIEWYDCTDNGRRPVC